MRKILIIPMLCMLLTVVAAIPSIAADQSVTGLPAFVFGNNVSGGLVEFEQKTSETTSCFITGGVGSFYGSDYYFDAWGIGGGKRWYFAGEALNGGYLCLGLNYNHAYYNGNKPSSAFNGSSGTVYSMIGYKKVFSSGLTLDGGIGMGYTTDFQQSSFNPVAKVLIGYSW